MINYLYAPLSDIRMYHRSASDLDIRYAFHEAGHALVCLGFGAQIEYATISPGEGYAGQVRFLSDSRGFGSLEQRAIVALAGYAGEQVGPFLPNPDWRHDYLYSRDLQLLSEAFPDLNDAEIDAWLESAMRCIRAWPETFQNLVIGLLHQRTLDWEGILNCVASREQPLRNHWRRFDGAEPQTIQDPEPEVSTTMGRDQLVTVLERFMDIPESDYTGTQRAIVDKIKRATPFAGTRSVDGAPSYRLSNGVTIETRTAGPIPVGRGC